MDSLILTGCTSGIGLAVHELLCSKNYNVFLGRDLKRLNQKKFSCYYEIDLAIGGNVDWDSIYCAPYPKSITFISNAGVITPIGQINDIDQLKEAIQINLTSPIEMISYLVSWANKKNIHLKIINISSGAATHPIAGWASYCVSKAGMKMFLDVIATENSSVEVIHFDPGVVDTAMQQLIRGVSINRMPMVNNFISYKEKGELRSPMDVAKELISIIESKEK